MERSLDVSERLVEAMSQLVKRRRGSPATATPSSARYRKFGETKRPLTANRSTRLPIDPESFLAMQHGRARAKGEQGRPGRYAAAP